MVWKRKGPGALARDATGAQEKGANTRYSRSRPQHQAHRLGQELTARRPALDGANTARARSDYLPGRAFMPDEETLSRRQRQVLELLKECGPHGVTRIEAPDHLVLSFSQRISELRQMGYRIDTIREPVGDANIARYVLRSPVPDATGYAETQ